MNSTIVFIVTIIPYVVTDTIRIIPSKSEGLACFKLEISGCDPKGKKAFFHHLHFLNIIDIF